MIKKPPTPHSLPALALVPLLVALALLAGPAASPALVKGIHDVRLERSSVAAQQTAIANEIGQTLDAGWARLFVHWDTLEPTKGTYSAERLTQLDAVVDALHAAGAKVILTPLGTPTWAQDQYWWKHPPAGTAKGPQTFYPPRSGALGSFNDLGYFLAMHFAGRVQALECWNEPNMYYYLYPQRTARDANFGARTYLSMLRAFNKGVDRAHTNVKVVAGASAPLGRNNAYGTSPLRFARFLKAKGARAFFDVYSHHPYVPGGTANPAPGVKPRDPTTTVTLGNLGTLLKVFPTKPFYLTEYGYNTSASVYFGSMSVSKTTQARYLKAAYATARRHRQVKVMIWFLLYDWRPASGPAKYGIYTGLRTSGGAKKPAWSAFRALP